MSGIPKGQNFSIFVPEKNSQAGPEFGGTGALDPQRHLRIIDGRGARATQTTLTFILIV